MLSAVGLIVWLAALSLQFADIGTARFDYRRLARGTRTVVRLHPVAWVVPLAAIAIIGLGFGIEFGTRLLFDEGNAVAALLVGVVLVAAVVGGWLLITVAATNPPADSYRAIRDELVELRGSRVQQEWLDALRARLEAIDDAGGRAIPPVELSLRSTAGWVVRRPQRLIPPLLPLVTIIPLVFAAAGDPSGPWLLVAAILAIVLSAGLSVLGARRSLELLSAVREAQVQYRLEAEQLLIEAEKTSRKPVAGLGERVTRALQILREQQS
jgi:hypothetical protein